MSSSRHAASRNGFSIKLAPLKENTPSSSHDSKKALSLTKSSLRPPFGQATNDTERSSIDSFPSKLRQPSSKSLIKSGDDKENPVPRLKKSSPSGLLRHGERLEDLFGIPQSTAWDDPFYQKCRKLKALEESFSANEPKQYQERCELWWDILQASRQGMNLKGASLVRLHRRATSRLPWGKDSSSLLLLNIWLSFVKIQIEAGSLSDSQLLMRHLRAAQQHAMYHITLAQLEEKIGKSKSEVIKILNAAIEMGAQPVEILHRALEERGSNVSIIPVQQEDGWAKRKPSTPTDQASKRLKIPTEGTALFVVRETENGRVAQNNSLDDSNMSLDDEEDECATNSPTMKWKTSSNPKVTESIEQRQTVISTLPRESKPDNQNCVDPEQNEAGAHLQGTGTPSDTVQHKKPFSETSKHFSRLSNDMKETPLRTETFLSKEPNSHSILSRQRRPLSGALPRLKITGKARRSNPNQSALLEENDDENLNDASSLASSTIASTTTSASKKSKLALSKADLSYIFEWDPNKRFIESKHREEQVPTSAPLSDDSTPSLEINETKPKENEKVAENNPAKKSTDTDAQHKEARKTKISEADAPQSLVQVSSHKDVLRPEQNNLTTKPSPQDINPEFRRLASENNMLRVNGRAYAKLQVLGKGASCKVYSALAKNCTVVAIKKVKLDGLDQASIDSYANEIKLLQSLRGNPAIIRMYDSQVDLERKAIFVVMEPGEADLNHILQQQSLLVDSSGGRRRLNMNFVRLTWFQMLTAVHGIHEARIIHGDLKPANFLFVRGALKLIDFGIAKAMQNDDTTKVYRENIAGTWNYMSPEAFDLQSGSGNPQSKQGRASDIWSLGCILYQMVYGKTPFAHLPMLQKAHAIINPKHQIDYPEDAEVEEAAIDAIKACLRRDPAERLPIVGKGGLLNEHVFLNPPRKQKTKT